VNDREVAMFEGSIHAVTGAFGYSGKYIARRLLAAGRSVITLTNSTDRANEFGGRIPAYPFRFDQPDELARTLDGVDVLYNTYWVRFNHRLFRHADAVRNTLALFAAARRAGSVSNHHRCVRQSQSEAPKPGNGASAPGRAPRARAHAHSRRASPRPHQTAVRAMAGRK